MLLLSGRVVYFGEQGVLSCCSCIAAHAVSTLLAGRDRMVEVRAGHQAIEYFTALPTLGKGLVLESLKEGNNEAEWIVDLTTQADRQGRCKERLSDHMQCPWDGAAHACHGSH